jgi:hypothetical protein
MWPGWLDVRIYAIWTYLQSDSVSLLICLWVYLDEWRSLPPCLRVIEYQLNPICSYFGHY